MSKAKRRGIAQDGVAARLRIDGLQRRVIRDAEIRESEGEFAPPGLLCRTQAGEVVPLWRAAGGTLTAPLFSLLAIALYFLAGPVAALSLAGRREPPEALPPR